MSEMSVIQLLQIMGLSQIDLANQIAVVSGSGRGIGRELSRALAWLGAKVIIAEISDSGIETETIIKSDGGEAMFIKTDVSSIESMNSLSKVIFAKYGKVDILVNNATIFTIGSILDQPIENWEKVFNVNVKGVISGIKSFLPSMKERKHGVIITMTSDEGTAFLAPYSASKAALQSIAYSLAGELSENSGVSVFVFGPGMVDTPGGNEAFSKLAPLYGVSLEEFIKLGSVGGFEGMMPVEYSAAGFAYTIVHAEDYHGQIADPFRSLGKFGLLPGTKELIISGSPTKESLYKALDSTLKLKEVLEAIDKETEELNFFAKKWVFRSYSKRTGLSIQGWLATIKDLIDIIQKGDLKAYKNKNTWFFSVLEKLEVNFEQTKADAKGYIKDPEKLKDALKELDYRKNSVKSLIEDLKSNLS